MAQGDLAVALKSYRDGLAIAERLAQSDPGNAGWQRDLSVSYERVGDVQVAQGDLAGALKSYRDSLAIGERLAQSDPGNAGWQRDLSVSYDKLATCSWRRAILPARSSPTATASPSDRLAQSDPGNAGWQRDLSVSYEKVGDVQVAQGDLAGALKSYRDSLAIRDRLAQSDPGNAGWQRDLSVSYNELATCSWRRAILPARSSPTATASPSDCGRRNPIPATPAGSATLQSAMRACWRVPSIKRSGQSAGGAATGKSGHGPPREVLTG